MNIKDGEFSSGEPLCQPGEVYQLRGGEKFRLLLHGSVVSVNQPDILRFAENVCLAATELKRERDAFRAAMLALSGGGK